jgi:hypothetical protein
MQLETLFCGCDLSWPPYYKEWIKFRFPGAGENTLSKPSFSVMSIPGSVVRLHRNWISQAF